MNYIRANFGSFAVHFVLLFEKALKEVVRAQKKKKKKKTHFFSPSRVATLKLFFFTLVEPDEKSFKALKRYRF